MGCLYFIFQHVQLWSDLAANISCQQKQFFYVKALFIPEVYSSAAGSLPAEADQFSTFDYNTICACSAEVVLYCKKHVHHWKCNAECCSIFKAARKSRNFCLSGFSHASCDLYCNSVNEIFLNFPDQFSVRKRGCAQSHCCWFRWCSLRHDQWVKIHHINWPRQKAISPNITAKAPSSALTSTEKKVVASTNSPSTFSQTTAAFKPQTSNCRQAIEYRLVTLIEKTYCGFRVKILNCSGFCLKFEWKHWINCIVDHFWLCCVFQQ